MTAVVLALALAGCGFRLAGTRPLPERLESIYVDVVTPYQVSKPPLDAALRNRLLRRGAVVGGSASGVRAVLHISDLAETRDVLSVDPFGKAVEYRLTTRARYVLTEEGRVVVPMGTLAVSREYSFNAEEVLAKEAEEARLQSFMQDELAELLLLRLEAALNAAVAAPAGAADATPAR